MGVTASPPTGYRYRDCEPAEVAEILAALTSPSRLGIVRLLADTELDITDIALRLGASVATTSHHLGPLRRARLVISRREGTRILNRLAGPHVLELCDAACAATQQRRPACTRFQQ